MPATSSTPDETLAQYGAATWRTAAALLLFAIVVRGGALAALRDNLRGDPDAYGAIARSVAENGVYSRGQTSLSPTAYRPPLYPLVLSNFAHGGEVSTVGVALLHLVLGAATVWLTWRVAHMWNLGCWSLPAAALAACDPILLNQQSLVMTETLATFLAMLGLYCLTKFSSAPTPLNAALVGAALALASLSRPTFLPWLAFCAAAAIFVGAGWRRRAANVLVIVGISAAVVSPWVIRNYGLSSKPIIATTHGGYTLHLGNNSDFYRYLREGRWGEVWDSQPYFDDLERTMSGPHDSGVSGEVFKNRQHYQAAWRNIGAEPNMFAYSCLVRVGRLWGLAPHRLSADESTARRLLRYAIGCWYAVVFLLAMLGIFGLRGRLLNTPWLWGVLLCAAFTGVHTLYWSNLRMRAPLMPMVCLLAAVGAAAVGSRFLRRKSPASHDLEPADPPCGDDAADL